MRFFNSCLLLMVLPIFVACYPLYEPEKEVEYDSHVVAESKVLIVTHSTLDVKYIEVAKQNHLEYVTANKYNYVFRNGSIDDELFRDPDTGKDKVRQLGLYWQKIESVRQALSEVDAKGDPRYEMVLWVDADMLFTNFKIRIEGILAEYPGKNFLIASDLVGTGLKDYVNAGSFIIKNTKETHAFAMRFFNDIASLYPLYKDRRTPEQQAIQDLIFGYVTVDQNGIIKEVPLANRTYDQLAMNEAVIVPQKKLNSFYLGFGGPETTWAPEDFIAHFAVAPNKLKNMTDLVECMRSNGQSSPLCNPEKAQ